MLHPRRPIVAFLCLLATIGACGHALAQADSYPSKPIKLVYSFSAGGPGDAITRIVAEKAALELGQAIVVENRTGAGGIVGGQVVAQAEPDGYTVLMITGANVFVLLTNPASYNFTDSFAPVIGIGAVPLLLTVPTASSIHSIDDLATAARSTPNGLSYGSGGHGSVAHLVAASLAHALSIKATNVVYRGNGPAMQDLIANRIEFFFASSVDSLEFIRGGQIRALAVTSEARLKELPDVPTMKELGFPDLKASNWYGVLVPAKTPQPIIDKLYGAFSKAMASAEVQERLRPMAYTTAVTTGPEFGQFIRDQNARWKKVIEENHIKGAGSSQ